MPKTRNSKTEHAIRTAAWQLFFEKGIAATSYTDLAARSGVSRPLVQRYFPKKNLLVEGCVDDIRAAAVQVCDEAHPHETDPLVRLYLRGQVNIATYFACDGLRKIMRDVFSSRELTQQIIDGGFRWTLSEVLPNQHDFLTTDEPDELIMAMGGLYELIYAYLAKGGTPDIAACTLPSVAVFAEAFSVPLPPEGIGAHALAPQALDDLATRAVARIPWH